MKSKYIPDPARKTEYLSEAELTAMIEDVESYFPKHAGSARHLMLRMLATVHEANAFRAKANQQFQENRAKQQMMGRSTNLNPIDAVRFISSPELEKILQSRGVVAGNEGLRLKEEAQAESKKVHSAIGQVQGVLQSLLEGEDIPSSARVAVERALKILNSNVEDLPAEDLDTSDSDSEAAEGQQETVEVEAPGENTEATGSWVTAHNSAAAGLSDLFE